MSLGMPRIASLFGLGLVALGVVTYFASGRSSLTSLIPAALGVLLIVLGTCATMTEKPQHPMHGVAVVALLGFLGSVNGLPDGARLLAGDSVELPLAAVSKTLTAIAMGSLLALCVQSFRKARRARD